MVAFFCSAMATRSTTLFATTAADCRGLSAIPVPRCSTLSASVGRTTTLSAAAAVATAAASCIVVIAPSAGLDQHRQVEAAVAAARLAEAAARLMPVLDVLAAAVVVDEAEGRRVVSDAIQVYGFVPWRIHYCTSSLLSHNGFVSPYIEYYSNPIEPNNTANPTYNKGYSTRAFDRVRLLMSAWNTYL